MATGLSLKELIELALLDAVVDHPVTLDKLMAAGKHWHELSGRSDVRSAMADSLSLLLNQGLFTVTELNPSAPEVPLMGSDAAMILKRASESVEMLATVRISATDEGKKFYRSLAHRYYNNG